MSAHAPVDPLQAHTEGRAVIAQALMEMNVGSRALCERNADAIIARLLNHDPVVFLALEGELRS